MVQEEESPDQMQKVVTVNGKLDDQKICPPPKKKKEKEIWMWERDSDPTAIRSLLPS